MKKIKFDNYFWQNDLVRLRAINEEDWKEHYYNRFDSKGRRLLSYQVELPPTINEAKEFSETYKDFSEGTGRIMFTIENLDGDNVGGANINAIDEKNGTFSIGMQIDRDHRGKGYGTAAMYILLDYAFNERRLNKFYGNVLDKNVASATMLKKLGCSQEGRRKEMVYTDGEYHDELLFGLTKTDYYKNKSD